MSELLDKQVNVQKQSLRSSRNLPQAHEKVCDFKEEKTMRALKCYLWKEALYNAHTKNQ